MVDQTAPAHRFGPLAVALWAIAVIAVVLVALAYLGRQRPTVAAEPRLAGRIYTETILHPPMRGVQARTPDGRSVTVACGTCHGVDWQPKAQPALTAFHQGMHHRHGGLSCQSCHDPADGYQSLRLADGRRLGYDQSMTLCAQCHGPQARDYAHGAHGGMTGSWDLSRGGRTRQTCITCHDPHAPAYPTLSPLPPARDRFLTPTDADHD